MKTGSLERRYILHLHGITIGFVHIHPSEVDDIPLVDPFVYKATGGIRGGAYYVGRLQIMMKDAC